MSDTPDRSDAPSASETPKKESSASKKEHGEQTVLGVSKPKLIAGVAGLALVIITILQNTDAVPVNVLFWEITMPRWILLSLVFGAGAAAGVIIPRWRKRRRKRPLVG